MKHSPNMSNKILDGIFVYYKILPPTLIGMSMVWEMLSLFLKQASIYISSLNFFPSK